MAQRASGVPISPVGLGCNNFGRALDERASAAVVRAALDEGVTFFDTSDNYGNGLSEGYLGRALGSRRAQVIVASKFGSPVPGMPGTGGASPAYIARAVERSLDQLGTDYLDVYMLHKPDARTPIAETMEAMTRLVQAGTVREIACSNMTAEQIAEATAVADEAGLARFTSTQVEYSLLHRDPEHDGTLQLCREQSLGLIPYYPLASGLLTGKVRKGVEPSGRLRLERYQRFLTDRNYAIVERLRAFSQARDCSVLEVAMGWLNAQPQVLTVIAGATTPEQVTANVAAARWRPSPADLVEIAAITAVDGQDDPAPARQSTVY